MPDETPEHPNAPEQRTIDVDVKQLDTRGRTVHGYAAVYGATSGDLGGFREQIAPGAFAGVLADSDVRCLLNHDPNVVLGRTKSGTMRLADDERGLRFEVDLPESRSDLREAVARGDLDGASFRFQVGEEQWDGDLRTVKTVKALHDVTLATYPAYPAASIELRTRPENPTTAAEPQENIMDTENRNEGTTPEQAEERAEGGLSVEDRAAVTEVRTIEERLVDSFQSVKVGEVRALNTTDDAAIAPAELSSFLFQKLRASSVALQSGIRVIPTDRESIQWPKLSTDVSPDFYSEGGTITAGDPGFETLTAEPAKIAHRVELSNEIVDDSEPPVVQVLNDHVSTMLGLKLDAAIYTGGTAVPGITGMKNTAGIQTGGTVSVGGTAVSWEPIVEAVGMLREANAPEPYAIAGPPLVFKQLSMLTTTTGEQLPTPAGLPPIHQSTQLDDVYVYSPSEVVLVRRQDATVELDRSRLFHTDSSEVRGKVRADVLFPNPAAIVRVAGTA
ncbi:MAG: HK97 family phage prohead protease [Acidobacteria bacterium]|nr:MAG: HK97 family phage prohead protease [Acidobacteriota bacterium]